jgi:hypothetical protein
VASDWPEHIKTRIVASGFYVWSGGSKKPRVRAVTRGRKENKNHRSRTPVAWRKFLLLEYLDESGVTYQRQGYMHNADYR